MINSIDFTYATKAVDKLFVHFPTFGHFNVAEIIQHSNFGGSEKIMMEDKVELIEQLLVDNMGYAKEFHGRLWLELTDKGREAQKLGGHYKYLENQDRIKSLTEEKLKVDIKNAKKNFKNLLVDFFDGINWSANFNFIAITKAIWGGVICLDRKRLTSKPILKALS